MFNVRLCYELTMCEALCQLVTQRPSAPKMLIRKGGWKILLWALWLHHPSDLLPLWCLTGSGGRDELTSFRAPEMPPNYFHSSWLTYPCHGDCNEA